MATNDPTTSGTDVAPCPSDDLAVVPMRATELWCYLIPAISASP